MNNFKSAITAHAGCLRVQGVKEQSTDFPWFIILVKFRGQNVPISGRSKVLPTFLKKLLPVHQGSRITTMQLQHRAGVQSLLKCAWRRATESGIGCCIYSLDRNTFLRRDYTNRLIISSQFLNRINMLLQVVLKGYANKKSRSYFKEITMFRYFHQYLEFADTCSRMQKEEAPVSCNFPVCFAALAL